LSVTASPTDTTRAVVVVPGKYQRQLPATLLLSMSSLSAIQPGSIETVPVQTDVVELFFTQDESPSQVAKPYPS
jgi:hypothetical protein